MHRIEIVIDGKKFYYTVRDNGTIHIDDEHYVCKGNINITPVVEDFVRSHLSVD